MSCPFSDEVDRSGRPLFSPLAEKRVEEFVGESLGDREFFRRMRQVVEREPVFVVVEPRIHPLPIVRIRPEFRPEVRPARFPRAYPCGETTATAGDSATKPYIRPMASNPVALSASATGCCWLMASLTECPFVGGMPANS